MRLSTTLCTMAIGLSISAGAFASTDSKTCIYTACSIDLIQGSYTCGKISNNYYLTPMITFSPNTHNQQFSVGNYKNAQCIRDGKNWCELDVDKNQSCDLS